MARYELAVVNGTVVMPYVGALRLDLGIRDGRIAALAEQIPTADADEIIDARGRLVLPGAVDAHYHLGIYRPLGDDTESETRSSLVGGVTSVLSYFRTGQHYLNKVGPYRTIFPEVLEATRGRAFTDYGFHIAIMTTAQLDEVEWLVAEQGVTSFKFYLFYKGLNLAADSTRAAEYTMADSYDLGHLYRLMRRVVAAGAQRAQRVSLSVHCEEPELLRVFIEEVRQQGGQDLAAYHHARPPLAEQLAIQEVVFLANATNCPLNLLHLSGGDALATARRAQHDYPQLDVRLETTLHHLTLTTETGGLLAKVNPPIRTASDTEALWQGVRSGAIDWVGSDHACCPQAFKGPDLWPALPGFGGSALLYPLLVSEGYHRRGLSLTRVAELASANAARAFNLYPRKGTLAPGSDADLAIVDPEREITIAPEHLLSGQEYTPFAGLTVRGWTTHTLLRGEVMYREGEVVGAPRGQYLARPLVSPLAAQAGGD